MRTKRSKRFRRSGSYHVVILPDDSSQVHRLRVRSWQYRGGLVLSIVLLLALALTTGGYLRYRSLYQRTAEMRARYAVVQHEQARLASRLLQLERVVERSEGLAAKMGSLVQVASLAARRGLGPIEDRPDLAKPVVYLQELDDLEAGDFAAQFSGMINEVENRSRAVEQQVTTHFENYQDHLVRLASMPDVWPVLGWVTSRFGPRHSPITHAARFHEGIDIAAPWGIPVRASGDGVVQFAGYKGGLGNTVVVDHGFGLVTYYGHNSQLLVKEGDKIRRSQEIAMVGNTGHSTGPHLHYEIHIDGIPVDPMAFLPPRAATAFFDDPEIDHL